MSPMSKGDFVIGVRISLVVLDTHISQTCRTSPSLDGKALDSVLCSAESGGIVFLRNKRLQHHGAWQTLHYPLPEVPCEYCRLREVLSWPTYLCLTQVFPNVLEQRAPLSSTMFHGTQNQMLWSIEIKGPHGGLASVGSLRNLGPKNWHLVSNRSIQDEQIIEKVNHRRERNPPDLK